MLEIINYLLDSGQELIPCSAEEVTQLESKLDSRLPLTYRIFLLTMGKGAGNFMLGSYCFWNELSTLRDSAKELLAEDNATISLPPKAYVFWNHQGYQFAFFFLDDGEDPPIYYYYEGKNREGFEKKFDSLSSFYLDEGKTAGVVK